jgi:hypothetical protein
MECNDQFICVVGPPRAGRLHRVERRRRGVVLPVAGIGLFVSPCPRACAWPLVIPDLRSFCACCSVRPMECRFDDGGTGEAECPAIPRFLVCLSCVHMVVHQSMKRYRGFTQAGPGRGIRGVVKICRGGVLTNRHTHIQLVQHGAAPVGWRTITARPVPLDPFRPAATTTRGTVQEK